MSDEQSMTLYTCQDCGRMWPWPQKNGRKRDASKCNNCGGTGHAEKLTKPPRGSDRDWSWN